MTREERDRVLFDSSVDRYAGKEFNVSVQTARKHRLLSTLAYTGFSRDRSIIEMGCGAGFSARYLQGRYNRYLGVDYSSALIEFAKASNAFPGAEFRVGNIKTFKAPSESDIAVMIGVLHHIEDPIAAIAGTLRALRPGGEFVVNEPQGTNPLFQFARRVRERANAEYSDEQIQYRVRQLRNQMIDGGFTDVRIYGQGFFSTPFAEVPMKAAVFGLAAHAACFLDRGIDSLGPISRAICWNLIGVGRRPV